MRRVTHCLLAFPLVEDLIRTASARPGLWTPHNTIHESTLLSSAYAQSDHARPVLEAEDERFSKQPRLNRVANGEAYYLPANDHGATYQAHDFPGTGTGRHAPYHPEPLENHLHFHPEIAEGLDLQQLQRLIRVRAVSDTPYHPAPSQEHSQSYPGIWEGLDLQQLQSLLSDPELFSGHANVNQAGSGSHAEQQLYGSGHSPFDQQIHASGDPNFQQQLHHVGVPGIDSHFQQQLHGSGPSSLDQQLHGPGIHTSNSNSIMSGCILTSSNNSMVRDNLTSTSSSSMVLGIRTSKSNFITGQLTFNNNTLASGKESLILVLRRTTFVPISPRKETRRAS
ncbi:hypothetical protein KEM48_007858 [Puccinia striiformis f. sp. tritici PST-130]|nr:hypothetical protein KEM48_007858 [Puccinia striiformis f. sp. tritici PST-130]